ncbi:MAG: response regulator [Rubrivivax sp.]
MEISERERAQANLVHVQKLEAVGRLTGGIAHDFNNLLQVVNMSIDLLIRRAGDPKLVELATKAKTAVGRGRKLTAQLLSFARTQSLLPSPTELNGLITGMQELIAISIGSLVTLEIHVRSEPAWATLDAAQLEMALLNLAVNAKDAMPGGGVLTIATRCVEGVHHGLSSSRHVVVSVADTGTGIPEPLVAKVFEPFFTTKPVGSGTGLGLSQVYGFASQSGGLARVESKAGIGTTVELWFPATAGSHDPVGTDTVASQAALFRARQVLVIEDDPDVRRIIVESLTQSGHMVRSATSGADGLDQMSRQPPDVLVVDYAMPGMNGAQVIAQVRARYASMPILLATGYADMAEVARVLPSTSVLLKPFDIAALLKAVDDACATIV